MVRVVGKEGALGAGGVWELPQQHGRLKNDNEAISRAWKFLLLWWISILGGAFEQERARKNIYIHQNAKKGMPGFELRPSDS